MMRRGLRVCASQSCTRGMFDRLKTRKIRYEHSAIKLQSHFRRYLTLRSYRRKRHAAVVFQVRRGLVVVSNRRRAG